MYEYVQHCHEGKVYLARQFNGGGDVENIAHVGGKKKQEKKTERTLQGVHDFFSFLWRTLHFSKKKLPAEVFKV